ARTARHPREPGVDVRADAVRECRRAHVLGRARRQRPERLAVRNPCRACDAAGRRRPHRQRERLAAGEWPSALHRLYAVLRLEGRRGGADGEPRARARARRPGQCRRAGTDPGAAGSDARRGRRRAPRDAPRPLGRRRGDRQGGALPDRDRLHHRRETCMTNSSRLTAICVLAFGVLMLATSPWAQERPLIAEQIGKTYGLDSFGHIEGIRYTFNADFPGVKLSRTWVWEPKDRPG